MPQSFFNAIEEMDVGPVGPKQEGQCRRVGSMTVFVHDECGTVRLGWRRDGDVDTDLGFAGASGFRTVDVCRQGPRRSPGSDVQPLEVYGDRKSTRLNSSHIPLSRMPSSA